jgi:acyl carrier protein
LRLIRLASEASRASDVELYRKYFSSDCILVNALSSTETGIVSKYLIDRETQIAGSEVPVGYAVEDKEILLLDDSGREVGFNEVGEIAVKSRYLALGYYHEQELTKAKFRPASEGNEKRLYLTGDLGLMISDGCLVHKGRKDFRVKIRGYGVDTTEVERALLGHAGIKEAVVVVHASESGEAALVAYFTSDDQRCPTASELRRFLQEKLADYMIPSAFVMLDVMPLTHNGKVDRRALPVRDNSRPSLEAPFAAPTTPTEEELAAIWAEVLSLDRVGIHDNFFDLGGHSLAATRVVSQVFRHFQLELPLQSLFGSPTVAAMAAVITENRAKRLGEGDLYRILSEIESLSDEESEELIIGNRASLATKPLT